MKTENALIAEFMPKSGAFYLDPTNGITLCETEDLKYHTSWDWLMPVVEKINKLFDEAFPPGEEFVKRILAHEEPFEREYMDVVGLPISSTIDDVYQAVVTFIKWYNENKQP